MGKFLLASGSASSVPDSAAGTTTKTSTQSEISDISSSVETTKQGTGDISASASYNSDSKQVVKIEVTSTSTVDVPEVSKPVFFGTDTANDGSLTISDLGSSIPTGLYRIEVVKESNPEESASLNLFEAINISANGDYTDTSIAGSTGNRLVIEVYYKTGSMQDLNSTDVISDIVTGSGISLTEHAILSDNYLDYTSQLYSNTPIGNPSAPIASSENIIEGEYTNPPMFFWGTKSGTDSKFNYIVRDSISRIIRIFESGTYKYRILSDFSISPGLIAYELSGSYVVRVSLLDSTESNPRLRDFFYTHYYDYVSQSIQPIRTLGQFIYAIKQHNDSGIYINNQFSGSSYIVPNSNARYKTSLIKIVFRENLNVPNPNDLSLWQNQVLSFIYEGSLNNVKSNSNDLTFVKLTGNTLYDESVSVIPEVSGDTARFLVYSTVSSKEIYGLTANVPIAYLSLNESLSSTLPELGFDINIGFEKVDVEVANSDNSKLNIRVIKLQNDTVNNPREFYPYLSNVGFIPGSVSVIRNYLLRWTKYVAPLCNNAKDQSYFDNRIYSVLGGSGTSSDKSKTHYTLSDSSLYRPDLGYTTQSATDAGVSEGNTYSFKEYSASKYLTSPHARSNEFLPYLHYNKSLSSATISNAVSSISSLIDKFAKNALDYEVVTGPDSNYFILFGARSFTPETSGSYVNSNVIDEVLGANFCAGFFAPLTGTPENPLSGGSIYSFPVSTAYRESSLALTNPVPRGIIGNNPGTNSFAKFADDTVNTTVTSYYNEKIPNFTFYSVSTSDTSDNFSNHLIGLFHLVFYFVDTYLDDFLVTDSIEGTLVSTIRTECFTLMKEILDYMENPVSYATTLLTSYYSGDTEFSDKVYLYYLISDQVREFDYQRGRYLDMTSPPTFKLPSGVELINYKGIAECSLFLGALPYSTTFKTKMKELIDNKLSTGTGMSDDKILVVPKPDTRFWSVYTSSDLETSLKYISPYSRWGFFDNNNINDILMLKVAKVFLKGKWVLDVSFLNNPSLSLAPNVNQESIQEESSSAQLKYEDLQIDHWKIVQVNGADNVDRSSVNFEENDRIFNDVLWINRVRDTTFKIGFDCPEQKQKLVYGDEIFIVSSGDSFGVSELSRFSTFSLTFETTTSRRSRLQNGQDSGGPGKLSLEPYNSDAQILDFTNTAGTANQFLFAGTNNVIEFTLTPVVPLKVEDYFQFYVQGGKFKTYLNGVSEVTGLDIQTASQSLYSLLDIQFEFIGEKSFVVGDRWEVTLENENSANNSLSWSKKVWKTTTGNVSCVYSFASATSLDTFVICGHNIPASATVTLEGNSSDSWTSPPFSQQITVPEYIVSTKFPVFINASSSVSYQYYRLVISSSNSFIEIRRVLFLNTSQDSAYLAYSDFLPDVDYPIERFHTVVNGVIVKSYFVHDIRWSTMLSYNLFKKIIAILDDSKSRDNEPILFIEDISVLASGVLGISQNDSLTFTKLAEISKTSTNPNDSFFSGIVLMLEEEV